MSFYYNTSSTDVSIGFIDFQLLRESNIVVLMKNQMSQCVIPILI